MAAARSAVAGWCCFCDMQPAAYEEVCVDQHDKSSADVSTSSGCHTPRGKLERLEWDSPGQSDFRTPLGAHAGDSLFGNDGSSSPISYAFEFDSDAERLEKAQLRSKQPDSTAGNSQPTVAWRGRGIGTEACSPTNLLAALPREDDDDVSSQRPTWCSDVDLSRAKGFDGMSMATTLKHAKVLHHPASEKELLAATSETLYEQMGADDPSQRYVAVWLNMSGCSLVSVSQARNDDVLDRCLAGNFLKDRLKLILNPVAVKLPFPSKGPKDADTVGSFFGNHVASVQCRSRCGAAVTSIRIDLYSKWLLRMAMSKGGFQPGNIMEISLVDWHERLVLAGVRLIVTDEFMKLIS